MRKYVITGGPCSGKTEIIKALAERGFAVLEESSRIVMETHGILPWDNQELFCERFLRTQISRESGLIGDIVFLDRSLIDQIAYAEIADCRLSPSLYADIEAAKYDRVVFFCEMIPQYCTDSQRRETPDQAMAVHKKLAEVYSRLGFQVIPVPLFSKIPEESVKLRVDFILRHLGL